MDQAVALATPLVPAEQPVGFVAKMGALPAATKMKLGAALAALAATVVAMTLWASQGDWRVLYANLPEKEAGAIVAQL
jgi:flagellar M-ring protein FliF